MATQDKAEIEKFNAIYRELAPKAGEVPAMEIDYKGLIDRVFVVSPSVQEQQFVRQEEAIKARLVEAIRGGCGFIQGNIRMLIAGIRSGGGKLALESCPLSFVHLALNVTTPNKVPFIIPGVTEKTPTKLIVENLELAIRAREEARQRAAPMRAGRRGGQRQPNFAPVSNFKALEQWLALIGAPASSPREAPFYMRLAYITPANKVVPVADGIYLTDAGKPI